MKLDNYKDNFTYKVSGTLFDSLPETSRQNISHLAHRYLFTKQEVRIICEYEADFIMWKERSVNEIWDSCLQGEEPDKQFKKNSIQTIKEKWLSLKNSCNYSSDVNTAIQQVQSNITFDTIF